MSKKTIILIGGGGHCVSCIDVIEQQGEYEIMGILDVKDKVGKYVMGYPIIGTDDDLNRFVKSTRNFFISIGQIKSSTIRQNIYYRIKEIGGKLPIIISPLAYVSIHSKISEGSIIMHNAIVNAGATIGICCILNSMSLIEHEVMVGDFCHISTASCVNGQTTIGSGCFLGSNSVVKNNITIVKNVIVSASSFVCENINHSGIYKGVLL